MTITQAADLLLLSRHTLIAQVRRGKLRARKRGPIYWVTPAEVERYRRDSLGRPGRRPQQTPPTPSTP